MSLIARLAGTEDQKIAVHLFYASLAEFAAGEVSRNDIISYFNLDATEETELDAIISAYQAAPNNRKQEFLEFIHRMFILAEFQVPGYQTNPQLNARLNRF